jgi:hypothetical protein
LWSWDVETDALELDKAARRLWSIADGGTTVTFESLSARIHPADRNRVREAFHATRAVSGSYEIDFRIIVDDIVRWVSARGQGHVASATESVSFGVFLDVTDRKLAEESNELLAGEMSHRVKNLLAIASGLTTLTSRSTATAEEMARQLTQRLIALGRAHDLVRPIPGQQGEAALLGDLFTILLQPYDEEGAFALPSQESALASGRPRRLLSSSTNWQRTLSNTARSRWTADHWICPATRKVMP